MVKMKLADWAKENGISYLTANRHFHAGMIPSAEQLDSGTILVEVGSEEQTMASNTPNDAMSTFLKKTVEYSKNGASVEDFAAFVISNFTLKLNGSHDGPKYSRNKPKPEEVQKHFQQFLKPKGEKPKPNMFVAPEATLEEIGKTDGLSVEEVNKISSVAASVDKSKIATVNAADIPELNQSLLELFHTPISAEGVAIRSVDLTPQQLNYTGSTGAAFGSNLNAVIPSYSVASNTATMDSNFGETHSVLLCNSVSPTSHMGFTTGTLAASTNTFGPTQKELELTTKGLDIAEKSKRGRKPSKISRKQ